MTPEDGFVWYTSTPLQKLGLIPNHPRGHEFSLNHAISMYLCRWARSSKSITFAQFWSWCKSHDDSKERFLKYQYAWDQGEFSGITDRKLEILIRHFYPSLCIPKETHDMKVELHVPATKTIKNKYVEYTDFDPRKKYTILKPTPGCGKTYSTVQYLRHIVDRNVRIAWVTSRRALNQNMEGRLGVSLFTWNSYLDFDKDQKASAEFEKTDGVLISVQQLYHLQKKYDIVILD